MRTLRAEQSKSTSSSLYNGFQLPMMIKQPMMINQPINQSNMINQQMIN